LRIKVYNRWRPAVNHGEPSTAAGKGKYDDLTQRGIASRKRLAEPKHAKAGPWTDCIGPRAGKTQTQEVNVTTDGEQDTKALLSAWLFESKL
jgi:hypothetical protein